LDVEVFSPDILEVAHLMAFDPHQREHVTPFIKEFEVAKELSSPITFRWSVDDAEGLVFVREVFVRCDLCRRAVPHHTNARGSISGGDRVLVIDLHQVEDGGLAECTAADLLKTRTGGPVYESR
jgi:hypothetical protein